MTQLSDFSAEDAELIASLPYRVGIHVSYADDEEGEQDDEREMHALQASIAEVVKLQEGCLLTKEIAEEILSSKGRWEAWSEGVFNIEPLCEKAVLVLKTKADAGEVKAYIKITLEIAASVARAYGEFNEGPEPEKGFFGKAMSNIIGGFANMSESDANHPMNISAAEDSAISRIAGALKKNA